jgi:hypothetical protein
MQDMLSSLSRFPDQSNRNKLRGIQFKIKPNMVADPISNIGNIMMIKLLILTRPINFEIETYLSLFLEIDLIFKN